ncbi:Uncharacterised protein [Mycobacterium tuberculosis]|nr:Uncharacterised protein [Mycobacterium tuberculosis]CKV77178.1 Uncharacterised protein [Mycobacterium tuberculosis]
MDKVLRGLHRIAGLGMVFPGLERDPGVLRAVTADIVRAEHQDGGIRVVGPDNGRDVTQRCVIGRVVVEQHDLEIDALVASVLDHLEQARRGRRWSADTECGDLRFDRGHVDVLRNVAGQERDRLRKIWPGHRILPADVLLARYALLALRRAPTRQQSRTSVLLG